MTLKTKRRGYEGVVILYGNFVALYTPAYGFTPSWSQCYNKRRGIACMHGWLNGDS